LLKKRFNLHRQALEIPHTDDYVATAISGDSETFICSAEHNKHIHGFYVDDAGISDRWPYISLAPVLRKVIIRMIPFNDSG